MEFNEVVNYLTDNGYMQLIKNKPVFTDKFREALNGTSALVHATTTLAKAKESLESVYIEFITRCQIPEKAHDSYGNVYSLNKYSKEGAKAFEAAIKAGFDLKILAITVTLYYKSAVKYKKSIHSYMTSGEWKTDYQLILQKQSEGTLDKHIQDEQYIQPSRFTRG